MPRNPLVHADALKWIRMFDDRFDADEHRRNFYATAMFVARYLDQYGEHEVWVVDATLTLDTFDIANLLDTDDVRRID